MSQVKLVHDQSKYLIYRKWIEEQIKVGFSRWTSYLVPLFHPPYRGNKKVSKSSYDPLVAAAARSEDSLPRLLPLSSLL